MAEAKRSVGRPAQISRDRILEAVAASENVDAVTMRDLAARLGVSHGALYRWVADRHALFDLISEVLVGRVLDEDGPLPQEWSARLEELAARLRRRFRSVPGFAAHLARPHQHHAQSLDRLRGLVLQAFADGGADAEAAEQSWYAYITAVIAWIALEEGAAGLGEAAPRPDRFVAALLRGLPA